jgi:hypothetical protein
MEQWDGRTRSLLSSVVVILVVVAGTQSTQAAPSYSGTVSGDWSNPVNPTDTAICSLVGCKTILPDYSSNTVAWGSVGGPATAFPFGPPNTVTFTGRAFSSEPAGKEFDLGTLTYFNGISWAVPGSPGAGTQLL